MEIIRKIYYALTPQMRFAARRIWYFPCDLATALFGRRDSMTPPRGMIFIGSGDFVKQGQLILDLLVRYAGLTPSSAVLDVGCGIGRLAVPLTKYLNANGSYKGFDIVKKGIDWCNRHIASRYPNFSFLHTDLKNGLYNDRTEAEARNFTFPYPAGSFDCVVLTSVFTHMLPADVDHYLSEISRVMKPGGKCFMTCFLVNEEISARMKQGNTRFIFKYPCVDGCLLMDRNVRESNVAFGEDFLENLFSKHGLKRAARYYGEWSGAPDSFFFQDIEVAVKNNC